MKSLIITHSGFQDQELIYPYHRLREVGLVFVVAEHSGPIRGILGVTMKCDSDLAFLYSAVVSDFDLLVVPGGVKAMEKLRQNKDAVEFVQAWNLAGKRIAVLCSGAQLLITARILRGRRITTYPAMRVDVENAGAEYIAAPVVVDHNIISCPHYDHMAEWMVEVLK